tara:strand:- start:328 stop:723 length:396 start_codon:yes stop_codon:yes gene_type:complete
MMAKAFIDEHFEKPKEGVAYQPSDAQINFAKKIAASVPENVKIDDTMYTDASALSEFINANKKYLRPSEKQIGLIRSIKAKLPADAVVPEDVETSLEVAQAFIDQNMGGKRKSSGAGSRSQKSTGKSRQRS